jgi:hypothetical protein
MLGFVHLGLAGVTRCPEFADISEAENKALASATANVLEVFDIRPDPRIEAVVGLCVTASTIYGPRVYLAYNRKKKADKEIN